MLVGLPAPWSYKHVNLVLQDSRRSGIELRCKWLAVAGVSHDWHWSHHEAAAGCTCWIHRDLVHGTWMQMLNEFVHRQVKKDSPIFWLVYKSCFASTVTSSAYVCMVSSCIPSFVIFWFFDGWDSFLFLHLMLAVWRVRSHRSCWQKEKMAAALCFGVHSCLPVLAKTFLK